MKPERRSTRGRPAAPAADATAAKPAVKKVAAKKKPAKATAEAATAKAKGKAKAATAEAAPAKAKAATAKAKGKAKAATSKRKAGGAADRPGKKKKKEEEEEDATPRATAINDLPDEILGIIIGNSYDTWEASLRVCRSWREIAKANPPPMPREMREAARIVRTLTESEGSQVQGTLQSELLLNPAQVKCLGNFRVRRRYGGGEYHLFDAAAISALIEHHGGRKGLAMRIRERERKLDRKQEIRDGKAADRARAAERAEERGASRQRALEERIEKVAAEQAKDPVTENMSQAERMHLVSLHRQLYGRAEALDDFFSSDRVKPTLSVRAAVQLLRRLHVCETVRTQAREWATPESALLVVRACVSAENISNKAFELSVESLAAGVAEHRRTLEARARAFSLARSEARASHVATHGELIERLEELDARVQRSSEADIIQKVRRFFTDPAVGGDWPNMECFVALAREVEAVFEMVHRCLAHDDVRFYAWLPSTFMREWIRFSVGTSCRPRLGFNGVIDLTDIESQLHDRMRVLRREFLEDELKGARDGRRARFDSLSAACETDAPPTWAEMMRLYGLLFPGEEDRRPALADFFSKETMATEMSMEEVLRVRDRIGEIRAFHRESGSGALSSPFYLGRIGAIIGADAVHGADPLAADALTRSLPDHSAAGRRRDFANHRAAVALAAARAVSEAGPASRPPRPSAGQRMKTAEELVAWMKEDGDDDDDTLTVGGVEKFFFEGEVATVSMDDVLLLARRVAELEDRRCGFNQARSVMHATHVVTYEDLVERLAELRSEYDLLPVYISLYKEARLFFGARADSEWDLNAFLELAGRVEDVYEMVHRLIAHDDVRFYAWLAAKRPDRYPGWLASFMSWRGEMEHLPRVIGQRVGFRSIGDWVVQRYRRRDQSRESAIREVLLSDLDKIKSADLTDIESQLHDRMRVLRREFIEDELKAARDGRRARFDSLSAACETEVPASWGELMRLYGLLFPEEEGRRSDFFHQIRRSNEEEDEEKYDTMATVMSMEEVLRVRDRIGEIMAFHRESGSGALSSPFYLGRIGAIVGVDAVHGADPLAADALTRSLPDHSARRQDFASSRRADRSLKTADELVAWMMMKETDDGAWPAPLTVANVETFFDEEETVLSMDDVIQLADRADFSKVQLVLRGVTANQAAELLGREYAGRTSKVPHGGGQEVVLEGDCDPETIKTSKWSRLRRSMEELGAPMGELGVFRFVVDDHGREWGKVQGLAFRFWSHSRAM